MTILLLRAGIVKSLTKDKGDASAIFSFNTGGLSVLHIAASFGHLEVCKYLVEELRGDVNAPGYGPAARGLSLSVSPCLKLVTDMSTFGH
jgi:isopentenyl phosphate kinase